jgi:ParB family chromosome partitioning protein
VSNTEGTGGKRRQLGRGLSSLLGDDANDVAQVDQMRQTRNIAIEKIQPGRAQPRRIFDEAELYSLAESIREHGVLQPILVRRVDKGGDRLEIIAGERRWRAAQRAGLHEIPALVRELSDTEALEIALIENIQRSDLTALEEAGGFQCLIDEYGHTQEDVARAVGKSRSHVANTLRLLTLPPKARDYLASGRLTAGHARALLGSSHPDGLADYVVAGGLSVRATERLVQGQGKDRARKSKGGDSARMRGVPEKDADTLALERSITESLGLTVDITPRDEDRGALKIYYQSLDQLDDLLARLTAVSAPAMAPATASNVMFDVSDADDFSSSDQAAELLADNIDFKARLNCC